MNRIGIFLGVEAANGGMFQYAQSILDACASFPGDEFETLIATTNHEWEAILSDYPFPVTRLRWGKLALKMASTALAARLPPTMTRALSSTLNPIASQLQNMHRDIWLFPAQDAIAYQLNLPGIVSVHDLMHRHEGAFTELASGVRFASREHRFRNLAVWAKALLVDSELGRDHLLASYGVDPKKIHVLPYIPTCHFYRAPKIETDRFRSDLPPKFFLYPAKFWAHKNHQALITAAASIRDECPDIHLVFTGDKNLMFPQVHRLAHSLNMLGHITFLGYVANEDMPALYRRARAMVMPTFLGPTNIPPLEALACECPVAVSRVYAMPEQLGDAALYFDPRSQRELASTLQRLWLDDALCTELRERGRRQSAAWTPRKFSERLRQILTQVLV